MNMELISDYKNNDLLRKSFNDLAQRVFGISFENWYQQGLWKDNYTCYSYCDGDKIVANVSVTRMRIKIGQKEKKLIQIGTVMTDNNYRGRGLARKLMEYILAKYEKDCAAFFLFANQGVLEFYPKFEFQRKEQLQFFTRDNFVNKTGYKFRKLDMNKRADIETLKNIAKLRMPTSDNFFIENNEEILYWYCLEIFRENIYYCEEEGLIVICLIDEGLLHIYDVISKKEVNYQKILASFQKKKTVETIFYFTLNSDNIELKSRIYDEVEEDDFLFVKGDFSPQNIAYPITAHI